MECPNDPLGLAWGGLSPAQAKPSRSPRAKGSPERLPGEHLHYPSDPSGLLWGALSCWDGVSWDAGDPGFESHRCMLLEPLARLPLARLRESKTSKPLESDTISFNTAN